MKCVVSFICGLIVSVILITFVVDGNIVPDNLRRQQAGSVKENISKIHKGMTKNEVAKILDVPVYIDFVEQSETWTFPYLSSVSEEPRCVFDVNTNKVIDVVYEY